MASIVHEEAYREPAAKHSPTTVRELLRCYKGRREWWVQEEVAYLALDEAHREVAA